MEKGIYRAIANAMNEIEPIAKGQRNKEQGFQYRGIDDVMNSLAPILVKNKIFIYPEVTNVQRQERTTQKGGTLLYSVLTIKYHFAHEDGSELCCVVIGEGMDSGDKASNKAMAIAYKYACIQMFCIPTVDIDDPDATTPPNSTPINGQQKNGNGQANGNGQSNGEKERIGKLIGEILKTNDPDGQPFFNQKEVETERAIFSGAPNLNVINLQYERLKKELETRKANYKPIPFGDEHPHFENDIPWENKEKTNEQ